MSKNEALFGPHFGPYRPDARFGREDGPACASSTHSAMDERPGSALAAGMTRRCFLATAAAGFGMAVAACATGCSGLPGEAGSRDFDAAGHASLATIQDSERGVHRISIVMGGDVLAHRGIWMSGERADGTRNYDHLFSAIAPTFKSADIAIVNQETVLGGVEMGLSGFPTFNSPQELGDAEAAAGIDVALAATNHALDKGFEGIEATLRFWREKHPEMLVPGIADSNEAADRPHIVTRGRIAVAILNYTETTNGIPMPAEHPYCVKSSYRSNFAADVSRACEAGADIVIACPHWGTEYVYEPNAAQRRLASRLIEAGVDAIIGTHPHVLQPVELMHRPDGRRVPVFWSLGNLISRQMEAPRTVGGLAGLTVEKIGDACAITSCSIQPTVMHKTSRSDTGMRVYRLADYSDELAGGNNVETTEDFPSFTVAGCHDFASKVLGASYDRASSSLLFEVNPL